MLPLPGTAPLAAARPTGPGYCGVSTAVLAQSSRVTPLFLGENADAKTSPAPPTAVLITRSRRAEQAPKKLWVGPKVRAEPGGKSIYIYIYTGD